MYNYQGVKHSEKFGGGRVVFTGINYNLSSGRFTIAPSRLPDLVNGIVPAGTPISIDEVERTFDVHYAFSVQAAVTATGTKIRVAKDSFSGSRAFVGMVIMIAPSDIDTTGKAVAVTAIDRTNAEYDELTVPTGGLGTALAVGDVIVEGSAAGEAASVKVKPNTLLPYDLPKDPYATIVWADGCYNMIDGVVLENRIPPIADAVKGYMRSQDCYFRYSKSEE